MNEAATTIFFDEEEFENTSIDKFVDLTNDLLPSRATSFLEMWVKNCCVWKPKSPVESIIRECLPSTM